MGGEKKEHLEQVTRHDAKHDFADALPTSTRLEDADAENRSVLQASYFD